MRTQLIDDDDSYTFNLFHLLGEVNDEELVFAAPRASCAARARATPMSARVAERPKTRRTGGGGPRCANCCCPSDTKTLTPNASRLSRNVRRVRVGENRTQRGEL
jgi:hypothetical protein